MAGVSIYLNFKGNTEQAFVFYRSVFGGEFSLLQRFKDMPGNEQVKKTDMDKLIHISLPLNENVTLHGTDALDNMGRKLVEGNNVSILLDAKSKAEADTLFDKLSSNGMVEMPLQDTFWGAYYGSVKDQFGIYWMINFDKSQLI
jgi:PhnB protein